MANVVRIGGVAWHWAGNLVCAGPDERLVVIPDTDPGPDRAWEALTRAERMEWRDGGFRKWRIQKSGEGITFSSHYARFGPVVAPAAMCLAGMTNELLEAALAQARAASAAADGNPRGR